MRKLIYVILLSLCLTACQKNFDELADTDHREVTFTFNTSGYLDSILMPTAGGSYAIGGPDTIDSDHAIRMVGYCYNQNNELVKKQTSFGDLQHNIELKFNHLDRNIEYHFLFLADVVTFNTETDYYELWFHLLTDKIEDFYMVSFDNDDNPAYNILLRSSIDVTPSNQTVEIEMEKITYNGYCILTNLDGISAIEYAALYYQSFTINEIHGLNRVLHNNKKELNGESFIVYPLTISYADRSTTIRINKVIGGSQQTSTVRIENQNQRPFVATVDCNNIALTDIKYY
ncbi:MAG: hypothetical protein J5708_01190 [Bacteroidales bacterium]|nr:hypothetical protein [Bacteroidales bacterium]